MAARDNSRIFYGEAKPLGPTAVAELAARLGLQTAHILAFIKVESRFKAYDGQGRPTMLFEPAKFYKNLPASLREEAVRQGLAIRRWHKDVKYPRDSYPRMLKAMGLDQEAALMSASYGSFQILGENYEACGFESVFEMVATFAESEDNQLQAFGNFIEAAGIVSHLLREAWDVVGRLYNGPKYAEHNYHGKLRDAFNSLHVGPVAAPSAPTADMSLNVGSRGLMVKSSQQALADAGYAPGKIDGIYGAMTRSAVLAFQADNNLPTTGVIDAATWSALSHGPARAPLSEDRKAATVNDLRVGGSETIKAADKAQSGGELSVILGAVGAAGPLVAQAEEASGVLGRVGALAAQASDFVAEYWPLIAISVGLWMVWQTIRVRRARLEDHRSGRNRGR